MAIEKSPVSTALRELRSRTGFTQEGLARKLSVSLQTVALWETKRPPSGIMLARLATLAAEHRYKDLKQIFENALAELPPAVVAEVNRERERWKRIFRWVDDIEEAAEEDPDSIRSLCDMLRDDLEEAQASAWRNQR
jgi:transcriptional regulator with XRE-family HTH domain